MLRYCEVVPCDVIVLTGGTGFSPRDCTPEAVQPLFTKNVPGIQTALISESLKKTKYAMLSRYFQRGTSREAVSAAKFRWPTGCLIVLTNCQLTIILTIADQLRNLTG